MIYVSGLCVYVETEYLKIQYYLNVLLFEKLYKKRLITLLLNHICAGYILTATLAGKSSGQLIFSQTQG